MDEELTKLKMLEATKGSVRSLIGSLPKEVVELVVRSLDEMYHLGEAKGRVSVSTQILEALKSDSQ